MPGRERERLYDRARKNASFSQLSQNVRCKKFRHALCDQTFHKIKGEIELIQYDVVDENNNVVTSYEPKIKFTMSLLANLELKIIFGTVPDALECHSYEEAVEHRNQFYEIVKKYSLGEVTGNQCVLNKMYDDMFAQKGSYAFYIQWLNNEFPSEVEYQKKLQETKGLKKILVMATKPNHLATIE